MLILTLYCVRTVPTRLDLTLVCFFSDKPEGIQLQPNHTSYAINESTTSPSISCSAQCRPACVYRWTGPNNTSSNARLQFTNINRVQKGRYTCTVENSYGQISSSAVDLIVHSKYFNLCNACYVIHSFSYV